ncbi:hypothetical protein FOPG_13267 [Fusarium oxysporum f. sp. conglutinans race 2 54008]|uniref:Uncharacterized protein n=1 Tax=Fusarium oxysporum f. sp. conglutinans race 2 54008 TaxID=1089457 RepID=X0HGU9_FUSOX|nr:hypothetical protein FOPG_13267 [Fusarium oxysporum f. sp. conglutinans race 2 54008]
MPLRLFTGSSMFLRRFSEVNEKYCAEAESLTLTTLSKTQP